MAYTSDKGKGAFQKFRPNATYIPISKSQIEHLLKLALRLTKPREDM